MKAFIKRDLLKIKLLKKAKNLLARNILQYQAGAPCFICVALNRAADQTTKNCDQAAWAAADLRRLIVDRLATEAPPHGGDITLEQWLQFKKIVPFSFRFVGEGFEKVQNTRLTWIDSLIEEHGGTP